jgi:hypothetical protein
LILTCLEIVVKWNQKKRCGQGCHVDVSPSCLGLQVSPLFSSLFASIPVFNISSMSSMFPLPPLFPSRAMMRSFMNCTRIGLKLLEALNKGLSQTFSSSLLRTSTSRPLQYHIMIRNKESKVSLKTWKQLDHKRAPQHSSVSIGAFV